MLNISEKNKNIVRYVLEVLLFLALIAIDLLSKEIVFKLLEKEGIYTVLDGIFSLRLARNTGASFSILAGQITFLTIVPILASLGIILMLVLRPNLPRILRIGSIMITSGAIGNVVDRLTLGYVRDFIDYDFLYTWFNINFAIGNIADLFLCVGVVLIIVYIIFVYDDKDFYSKKKLAQLEAQKAVSEPIQDVVQEDNQGNSQDGK